MNIFKFFKQKNKIITFFLILFFSFFFLINFSWASMDAVLLEDYGDATAEIQKALYEEDPAQALKAYYDLIIKVGIGFLSIFALILIIKGGMEYIASESFVKKMDAKGDIIRGIGGLVLMFVSFIFFQSINPEVLNIRFKPVAVGGEIKEEKKVYVSGCERALDERKDKINELKAEQKKKGYPDSFSQSSLSDCKNTLKYIRKQNDRKISPDSCDPNTAFFPYPDNCSFSGPDSYYLFWKMF